MAMNIARMIVGDCVKAKPSAVPKKGAVHGVASTVAKTPWKNEPASPSPPLQESNPRVVLCGNEISKTPNKLSANTRTMTLKKRTKYAFVNWSPPQVISRPAALTRMLNETENLERDDWQNAWHQVQNDSAQKTKKEKG